MNLWNWITVKRDRELVDRLIEANKATPREGMKGYDPTLGARNGRLRWREVTHAQRRLEQEPHTP